MKPEDTIDFHIRWAWYNLSRMYNSEANAFGGSMAMGYALLSIDEEGTPSTKLAPKMGMEPRSLTRMIKALEENGYIEKNVDNDDKRLVKLFLTQKGKKKREIAKNVVLSFNERVHQVISDKDLKITFNVLSKVNEIIDEIKTFN